MWSLGYPSSIIRYDWVSARNLLSTNFFQIWNGINKNLHARIFWLAVPNRPKIEPGANRDDGPTHSTGQDFLRDPKVSILPRPKKSLVPVISRIFLSRNPKKEFLPHSQKANSSTSKSGQELFSWQKGFWLTDKEIFPIELAALLAFFLFPDFEAYLPSWLFDLFPIMNDWIIIVA